MLLTNVTVHLQAAQTWCEVQEWDTAEWYLLHARQHLQPLAQLCDDVSATLQVREHAFMLQFRILLISLVCTAQQSQQVLCSNLVGRVIQMVHLLKGSQALDACCALAAGMRQLTADTGTPGGSAKISDPEDGFEQAASTFRAAALRLQPLWLLASVSRLLSASHARARAAVETEGAPVSALSEYEKVHTKVSGTENGMD